MNLPTARFSRSRVLARFAASVALLSFIGAASTQAAAPMVKTSAPGYFRFMLGAFEITALSDGTTDLPADTLLMGTTPAKVDAALAKSFLKSPLETSVNGYLVNTGPKLILIDTGAGTLFGPTLGKLVANLIASGYRPEQVDEIFITHMHPDHVGGLVANGKIVFPNAVVRAGKADADFWLDDQNLAKAPADAKGFFQGAMVSLNPYVKSGQFRPITGNGELAPGIAAIASPGHTPGHTSYVIQSEGHKLEVWGDLIHVGAVQFAEPGLTIKFDSDPAMARRARDAAFADAAKNDYWVAGAHLPFPGIGHIQPQGTGYRWIPINYSVMR